MYVCFQLWTRSFFFSQSICITITFERWVSNFELLSFLFSQIIIAPLHIFFIQAAKEGKLGGYGDEEGTLAPWMMPPEDPQYSTLDVLSTQPSSSSSYHQQVLFYIILYYILSYYMVLYYIISYYIMPCYVISHYTIFYCVILYFTVVSS